MHKKLILVFCLSVASHLIAFEEQVRIQDRHFEQLQNSLQEELQALPPIDNRDENASIELGRGSAIYRVIVLFGRAAGAFVRQLEPEQD